MVIDKTNFCFNGIKWVLLARSTDKGRSEVLRMLYSSGSFVAATDGYRAHKYQTDVLPKGLYRVITATKNLIVVEPDDTDSIFPDIDGLFLEEGEKQICDGGNLPHILKEIILALPEDRSINPDFLKDALSAAGDAISTPVDFTVACTSRGFIKLTNCEYEAVFTPFIIPALCSHHS